VNGFSAFRLGKISAPDRAEITAFLDSCPWSSAYQYPYAGADSEWIFRQYDDGRLSFCGRASEGLAASRALPFLRCLAFNRGPVARDCEALIHGVRQTVSWAKRRRFVSVHGSTDIAGESIRSCIRLIKQLRPVSVEPAGRTTLRLDLERSEKEVFDSLHQSGRYKIRQALRAGVEVRPASDSADLEEFLNLHEAMTDRKGLPASARNLIQRLWEYNSDENYGRCPLFMASAGGRFLGGLLSFRCGRRTEYLFGATTSNPQASGQTVSPGYLLMWHAILWARSMDCNEFDLGGFDPDRTGGPAQMKRAFFRKPEPLRLAPAYRLHIHPGAKWIAGRGLAGLRRHPHELAAETSKDLNG